MSRKLYVLHVVLLLSIVMPFSVMAKENVAECPSPYEYIKKVYSADSRLIEYELAPDFEYKRIDVVFFGKRGLVLRTNTTHTLETTKGRFEVPKRALIDPPQIGFNFIITDKNNCKRWGLVDETTLKGNGGKGKNKIKIDRLNENETDTAFIVEKPSKE